MSIVSIAGVMKSQSGYEFPDYQEKIEQLKTQMENLQNRIGKVSDDESDVNVRQQRVEMIQSQISQIQVQIQRLQTMDGNRNTKEVSAELLKANLETPERIVFEQNPEKKTEEVESEKKLDVLV